MKKKHFVRLMFFCVISLCTACSTTPVYNIMQSGFSAPKERTIEDVQQAIIKGANQAGWVANVVSPTEILAAYSSQVKKGQGARVTITYDLNSYRIYYLSSLNLDYKTISSSGINYPISTQNQVIRIQQNATIENVYNEWVTELNENINKELNAIKVASKAIVTIVPKTNKKSKTAGKICNHKPDNLFSKHATVKISSVNIRDGASMKCGIVGYLNKDEKLTLLGRKRNWYYFKTKKNHAWIHKNVITIDN